MMQILPTRRINTKVKNYNGSGESARINRQINSNQKDVLDRSSALYVYESVCIYLHPNSPFKETATPSRNCVSRRGS